MDGTEMATKPGIENEFDSKENGHLNPLHSYIGQNVSRSLNIQDSSGADDI